MTNDQAKQVLDALQCVEHSAAYQYVNLPDQVIRIKQAIALMQAEVGVPDDTPALIAENERLKSTMNPDWDVKSACMEIAARLRVELAMLRIEMGRVYRQQAEDLDAASDAMEFAEKERDQLRARIAELEGQEPVAWAYVSTDGQMYDIITPHQHSLCEAEYTVPLFIASGAAPKVEPEHSFSLQLLERLSKTLTKLGYATPEGDMEQFNADLPSRLYNLCRGVDSFLAALAAPKEPYAWEVAQNGKTYLLSAEEFTGRSYDSASFKPLYLASGAAPTPSTDGGTGVINGVAYAPAQAAPAAPSQYGSDELQALILAKMTAPAAQEPLTKDEIGAAYIEHDKAYAFVSSRWSFDAGVEFAETHHGIGTQEQK